MRRHWTSFLLRLIFQPGGRLPFVSFVRRRGGPAGPPPRGIRDPGSGSLSTEVCVWDICDVRNRRELTRNTPPTPVWRAVAAAA
eukprot:scaffold21329_cov62-Phaeocystis_antarctica.AAC.10